ncbi:MAG: hypothetical protein ACQSGP_13540 [Frankia sp.]
MTAWRLVPRLQRLRGPPADRPPRPAVPTFLALISATLMVDPLISV